MPAKLPAGLLACAALSVLAHVGLMACIGQAGEVGRQARRVPAPAALSARLAPPDVGPMPAATEAPPELPAAAPGVGLEAPSPLPQQPVAAVPPAAASPQPAAFDEDDYIPRPRLSVPPAALQPVLLAWPTENAPPAGRYTAVLSLFIDEQGRVQRIRFDDEALPPALREQAQAAFAGMRYTPGQLGGRVVKSRIRLEVSFEAEARMVRGGSGF